MIDAWVDSDARLIRFRIVGAWTTAEMIAAIQGTLDRIAGQDGYDLVSDHRQIGTPATPEQIRALVRLLAAEGSALRGRRAAVVVSTDASYGMMRMLGAHMDAHGLEISAVRSPEEAMAFVNRPAGWFDEQPPAGD